MKERAPFATSAFVTKQNISRIDGLLFLEYDFTKWYGVECTIGAGAGIAHGVLQDLNMYQVSNGAFIGQSLKPNMVHPSGYVSFSASRSFEYVPSLNYQLGYHMGIAGVGYEKKVMQSQPDSNADLPAQNAFNLLNDISVVKAPYFTVLSHELSLGLQWEF